MSQKNWIAEFEIDIEIVASLLQAQFPDLTPIDVRPLAAGWDNSAFLVNESYVFRFPRRKEALELIRTEIRVLPKIADKLPLQITAPLFIGLPSELFPYHFAGYKLLPGRTAETLRLNESDRTALARPLAEFLAALHVITEAEAINFGAQREATVKTSLAKRVTVAKDKLLSTNSTDLDNKVDELAHILESFDVNIETPYSLVHGDFHARHFLIEDSRLSGIIDWGDVQIGHPSTDLGLIFLFFSPSSREEFCRNYGPKDDSTLRAAQIHAACDVISLLPYAIAINNQDLLYEVRQGLQYLLA